MRGWLDRGPLGLFVRINAVVALSISIGLIPIWLWVVDDYSVSGITVGLLVNGIALIFADRALARGQTEAALKAISLANWIVCVVATFIAPFVLPVTLLGLLIPLVLAIPHLSAAALRVFIAVTCAVAVALTVFGATSDPEGLVGNVPDWLENTVLIVFAPMVVGLISIIVWQNQAELRARADALTAAQQRLVATADRTRRRIERDLHDGAQQRLVSVAVTLGALGNVLDKDPVRARQLVVETNAEVQAAVNELRDLAHGLYPPLLAERGLTDALSAAARRLPLPAQVRADGVGRFAPEVEATAYFCCLEALQNAVKHAGPDATVEVQLSGKRGLEFSISDTGIGFDSSHIHEGHGFVNLRDRLGVLGGTLDVRSKPGAGTTVQGAIPAARVMSET